MGIVSMMAVADFSAGVGNFIVFLHIAN